jgi:hypothetical protein
MATALLLSIALAASSPGAGGVWQGTVGNLPIHACFSASDPISFGAYYYDRHRRLIALEAEEDGGLAFRETDVRDTNQPRWQIDRVSEVSLHGRWSQGRRILPVRLRRLALAEGEDGPCASMTFNRPRLAGIEIRSRDATLEGRRYRRLTLHHDGQVEANVESFALDREDPAGRRIDALLSEPFSGDPPEWFECLRAALERFPHEGSFDHRLEPVLFFDRWLSVVQTHDSYCGGNHPNGGTTYRLFDLSAGSEMDVLSWFGPAAVERSPPDSGEVYFTLKPALRDAILSGWRSEVSDCDEAVRSQDFWNAGVTRQGFVFQPSLPHVIRACGEEFRLSFERARPFLNGEGRAAIRSLGGT